jgi:hypothetical protein
MSRISTTNSYSTGGLGALSESPTINVVADVQHAYDSINQKNAGMIASMATAPKGMAMPSIGFAAPGVPSSSVTTGVNVLALAGVLACGIAAGAAVSKMGETTSCTAKPVSSASASTTPTKPTTTATSTPAPAGPTSKPSDIPEPPKSMPPPNPATFDINLPEESVTTLKGTKGWKAETPTSLHNAVLATEENKKYAESKGMTKTIPGPDGKDYYVTPADYEIYKAWQAGYTEKGGKIPPPVVVENLGPIPDDH